MLGVLLTPLKDITARGAVNFLKKQIRLYHQSLRAQQHTEMSLCDG